MLASYTYSRTVGNYPGLFQASNGQLDPNISTQYDLRELLVNRDGPLPNVVDFSGVTKRFDGLLPPLQNPARLCEGARLLHM